MAIPSEFNDNLTKVGPTNILHPVYTFKAVMHRRTEESVGPNTNSRTGTMLHPDSYNNSPDSARTSAAQHAKLFSSYLPGQLGAANFVHNDDGTFTAYGQQAVYLKKQYADIANPLLEVV